MKPEPLSLERIESIILDEMMGDLTFNAMMREIKKQIKSACEFYLKYKDNPKLFVKNHPEYVVDVEYFQKGFFVTPIALVKYNEWLFKLAFKDVLRHEG